MRFQIIKQQNPLSVHIVWIILLFGAIVSYRILPSSGCIFHDITGIPCLTCGASRAAECLFTGEFINMIYFNPLLVIFCSGLCFFSLFKLAEFIFKFKLKVSLSKKKSFLVRLVVLVSIITNWLFLIVMGR